LLFGVGIGHGNGGFVALGKRYAVIRVKFAVFGLYEVVTIYVGHICLAHGVSARVERYSLAEFVLSQGYGLIADGHGNFVIIGQFNAILKPFNLLYHGQLGLFGNTLVFVDDGDIGLAVVRYRHAEYFVYTGSFIIRTVFQSIHACKLIAVYIGEINFLYVVTVFFKLKRMGEAVRLVQLEGPVNRLIRVIHVHGNFVIIGNVNAFNGFLYGKLTGLDYRAMLDIFVCDNNNPAVVVLIKCYLEALVYIPLPNRCFYEIVIWNIGLIGFAYSIFLANLNLELYLHKVRYAHGLFFVADLHLYSVILRKLSYAVAIYGLTYFNLYLPRFGSGGRRGVDFPLGDKLCVGIHVKALSFAYIAARTYLLGEGQFIAALCAFCIIGHFPAEEIYFPFVGNNRLHIGSHAVGGMLPVLYVGWLAIIISEFGIFHEIALATAVCVAAAHGCPPCAVIKRFGKLGVIPAQGQHIAVVVFNINGLRYGRNLNKYVVTMVAIAVAAVAEILAVKLSGQLERAVILLYRIRKAEGNVIGIARAPCLAAVRAPALRVYAGHNYSGYIVALLCSYGKLHALLRLAACGSIIAAQRRAAGCACCVGILMRNGGAVQRHRSHARAVLACIPPVAYFKGIVNNLYAAVPVFLIKVAALLTAAGPAAATGSALIRECDARNKRKRHEQRQCKRQILFHFYLLFFYVFSPLTRIRVFLYRHTWIRVCIL